MGQEESELASDKELEGSFTSYQSQQGALSPLSGEKALSLRGHGCLAEWRFVEPAFFLLKQDVELNGMQLEDRWSLLE